MEKWKQIVGVTLFFLAIAVFHPQTAQANSYYVTNVTEGTANDAEEEVTYAVRSLYSYSIGGDAENVTKDVKCFMCGCGKFFIGTGFLAHNIETGRRHNYSTAGKATTFTLKNNQTAKIFAFSSISIHRIYDSEKEENDLTAQYSIDDGKTKETMPVSDISSADGVADTGVRLTAENVGIAYITVYNTGTSKPVLNKQNTTLCVRQTRKLKVTNLTGKVTWKSSNQEIATVSNAGKVTGKKAGTCTISAKIEGMTVKCKVTVRKHKWVKTETTGKDGTTQTCRQCKYCKKIKN